MNKSYLRAPQYKFICKKITLLVSLGLPCVMGHFYGVQMFGFPEYIVMAARLQENVGLISTMWEFCLAGFPHGSVCCLGMYDMHIGPL